MMKVKTEKSRKDIKSKEKSTTSSRYCVEIWCVARGPTRWVLNESELPVTCRRLRLWRAGGCACDVPAAVPVTCRRLRLWCAGGCACDVPAAVPVTCQWPSVSACDVPAAVPLTCQWLCLWRASGPVSVPVTCQWLYLWRAGGCACDVPVAQCLCLWRASGCVCDVPAAVPVTCRRLCLWHAGGCAFDVPVAVPVTCQWPSGCAYSDEGANLHVRTCTPLSHDGAFAVARSSPIKAPYWYFSRLFSSLEVTQTKLKTQTWSAEWWRYNKFLKCVTVGLVGKGQACDISYLSSWRARWSPRRSWQRTLTNGDHSK